MVEYLREIGEKDILFKKYQKNVSMLLWRIVKKKKKNFFYYTSDIDLDTY